MQLPLNHNNDTVLCALESTVETKFYTAALFMFFVFILHYVLFCHYIYY